MSTGTPRVPKALNAGALAAFAVMLVTLAECVFWISAYSNYNALLPPSMANSPDNENTLVAQIVVFALLAIISLILAATMALGGAAAQRGRNGGRIAIWVAGGFAIAWHLCCGTTGLLARLTTDAFLSELSGQLDGDAAQYSETLHKEFPMWQVDVAVGCGVAAGVLATIAIILVAQTQVNHYFRDLRLQRQ